MFESCEHLKNHKRSTLLVSYKILHAHCVVRIKDLDVICNICEASNFRQHACLECVFFGCFHQRHIHEHAEENQHFIAMDAATGFIFCFECKDYIYDEAFDVISRKQKQEAQSAGAKIYFEWEPSKQEIESLRRNQFRTLKANSYTGLRGLYNMDNSCYMNSVIQVLVHTPLLRNYFFADQHVCELSQGGDKNSCWGCIMADIFQEFYSGCSESLPLPSLLYVLWRDFPIFNTEMQDAEEFYSAILQALHLCESQGNALISEKGHCKCIIHQIFSGFSESKITCRGCGDSTKNYTSFWDLNLNFGPDQQQDSETKLYLETFIKSYTDTESLDSVCGSCFSTNRTIQVTLKKLPLILCFQLKRLIYVMNKKEEYEPRKITNHVIFPERLDMAPYLSVPDDTTADPPNDSTMYNLFAVLVHKGELHGHNFSYIRVQNSWYKCNDDEVYEVEKSEMLNCDAYLLYYHKCLIEYDPNSDI